MNERLIQAKLIAPLLCIAYLILNIGRVRPAALVYDRFPIILVPGDGGNQIWAKLNRTTVPHYWCDKTTADYYNIWLNLEELAPLTIDCWVDDIRLVYDNVTRKTSNVDGVYEEIRGWGMTETVAWLDPNWSRIFKYYAGIVDAATSNWGYTIGKDIRGAPYDFRKAPNELQEYFTNLTQLIEETYAMNGNVPVITVGHSMGNLMMLYLLKGKTQAWKNKYIKSHVAIAPPWGGAVKTTMLFASGYNLDQYRYVLPPFKLRTFERTMVSSAWLLPNKLYWNGSETLVTTEKRNYTVNDYQDFFNDINWPVGWEMFKDTKDLINPNDAPGVEVHCLLGTDVPTPESFSYAAGYFPDYLPSENYGDGDGSVNVRSGRVCLNWRSKQKQKVFYREFPKREHVKILQDVEIINYVKTVALSKSRFPLRKHKGSDS